MGCVEGDAWTHELAGGELSPRDALWVNILRADVGLGRGDHRQMFAAAAMAAQLAAHIPDDPEGACLAAYYAALGHLTDASQSRGPLEAALGLARQSGDPRLVTLIEVFLAVADLAAGHHDRVHVAVTRLERLASEDGYDRFVANWSGWMLALAERDAVAARRWMTRQHDFLDGTGIVENWLSSLSTAMCEVIEGKAAQAPLAHALVLADREGYKADADCVLVLAFAEIVAGRFETAAELIGTAMHGRFNATAHYVLYRAVLERVLRTQLDEETMSEAMDRGRGRTPADALAEHGVTRTGDFGSAASAPELRAEPAE